jgi:hypothetical protein
MTPQKKLIDGEALPKVNIDIQEKTLAALPWPLNPSSTVSGILF